MKHLPQNGIRHVIVPVPLSLDSRMISPVIGKCLVKVILFELPEAEGLFQQVICAETRGPAVSMYSPEPYASANMASA